MSSRNHLLDQHFLKNVRLALMLIGHSNLKRRDTVVEIGAGSGVITAALAKKCREVYAIEKDPETFRKLQANLKKQKLQANLKEQNFENVKLVCGDFREVNFDFTNYKVFSNPPFSLSAEVFYKLLNLENQNGQIIEKGLKNPPRAIYLILQKQLALKLILSDRHYTSQLGYILNKYYTTKIRYPLKSTDFTPPPKVPIVLFEAKIRPEYEAEFFGEK